MRDIMPAGSSFFPLNLPFQSIFFLLLSGLFFFFSTSNERLFISVTCNRKEILILRSIVPKRLDQVEQKKKSYIFVQNHRFQYGKSNPFTEQMKHFLVELNSLVLKLNRIRKWASKKTISVNESSHFIEFIWHSWLIRFQWKWPLKCTRTQ